MTSIKERVAIWVSQHTHCLAELLATFREGRPPADIVVVVSNHRTAEPFCQAYDVLFVYYPLAKQTHPIVRAEIEGLQVKLMRDLAVSTIVLARYMQVLTKDFVEQFPNRIINLHHSLLPSFAGGMPYERAFERGVKMVGATAHYVTEDLDQDPIIAQDAVHVDADSVIELKIAGAAVERQVLLRAVQLHLAEQLSVRQGRVYVA